MNLNLLQHPLRLGLLAASISLFSQTAAMAAAGVTVTPATGGGAISADTVGGSFTALTGPVLAESGSGQIGLGALVINAPSGFIFDTTTVPVVKVIAGDNSQAVHNINTVAVGSSIGTVTVTTTNIFVIITAKSSGGTPNTLTWSNIRVRPTSGTPLASGDITRTATGGTNSIFTYASSGGGSDANWGPLTEVAGGLAHFVLSSISSPQTAGTAFAIGSITAQDQFNNTDTNFTGTVDLTETGGGAGGSVSPTQSGAFVAGVRSSQSVTLTKAGSGVTITATDHAGTGKTGTSAGFTVNPGLASKLVITSVPANGTVGATFSVTVQSQDANGNVANVVSSTGISLAPSGTGILSGNTGTISSGANSVTLNAVQYTKAEVITLTASRTSGDALATSAASSSISFGKATPSITGVTASQTIIYGTPNITLSGTVSAPGPIYPANGETVSVTINGSTQNATISGGAGGFSINFPTAAISHGGSPYMITYGYNGDANLTAAANNTGTALTVNKANPTVTTWPTASLITYGQTLSSSTLSGWAASPVGIFTFTTPSTAPGAGTASQSVTYTPTDTVNYNTAVGSVNVTVNKATPSVTTWPSATGITYGQALSASTLNGGSGSVPGGFGFTSPSTTPNAGTYSAAITFTPSDTSDYNTVSGSINVAVAKANSTVRTLPTATAITYGQTLAASTLSGGTGSPAGGSFAFTSPATVPGAGTSPQNVTYTPTDSANYKTANGMVSVTVSKADPTVTAWPTASPITFGQTLSASTLNGGVASPAGAFAFTTPSITPSAGTGPQSVTYTPIDTADYNAAIGTISITVNQANPTVTTWPTASGITYGQALSASTLNGGLASVPGRFDFTSPLTTPSAGTYGAGVTFSPTDSVNYSTVAGSVNVAVAKATPTITTPPTASVITYGQTLAASVFSGGVASPPGGTFTFTLPSTVPTAGTGPQSVTYTPTDTANYNNASTSVSVTVDQLAVVLTGTRAYDGTTAAVATILTLANRVGSDVVTLSGSGTLAGKNIGTQSISVFANLTLGGAASANYTISGASGSVIITAAALSITADNDTKAYGDAKTYGPGFTAFSSSGLQNGETVGSVTITANGGTAAADPVGNYTLTPSAAVGGTFTAGNYSITYHDGTLEVMPNVHGTMTLDNYLGPTAIVVKFVAKDSGGVIVGQDEVAFPASGATVNYSIGVPTNTKTLSVKPRFYLRKHFDISAQLAGQNTVSSDLGTFMGGDVNEDNQVDSTDYAWLRTCWGTSGPLYPINGSPTNDLKNFPDLNGDGTVDSLDYNILKDGWYQLGDPE